MTNNNSVGEKTTFWKLVQKSITIPTLQRDYIYGAGTEKTEEVLNHMLETFKQAIEKGLEETLDFVYGSESRAKEFMPLDGQQRLTTLYLLHYYAALIAKHPKEDEVFECLKRFSYATRNCTIAFCNQLLIGKYKDIKDVVASATADNGTVFSSYLKDLDEFRGSFYTDPSVMSMMVVLDRIHLKFYGMNNLLNRLMADDCPINFYKLDFGVYDLSDDLYNKMNSRGKPLTSFEIVKAKIHKQIKKNNVSKADKIAIKFDTTWMQFIWEILGRTTELKKVDPAYMWFLRNVFRCFDYIAGYTKQRYDKLDDECLLANTTSTFRMKAMENVFDTLSDGANKIPNTIKDDYTSIINDIIKSYIPYTRMLMIYAIYLGLYYKLDPNEFYFRYRHVRNLINNSSDYMRENFMPELFYDVTHVMQGKLLKLAAYKMNENSWSEEQEKEKNRSVWAKFFNYEDIDEINGSLNSFAIGLNTSNTLVLSDIDFVNKLFERVEKAAHFFNTKGIEEFERRSALLSLGCYAMVNKDKSPAYRYFGVIKGSWQNFTGYHRFDDHHYLMNIFDQLDSSYDIHTMIGDTSHTTPENWRYYAIKYTKLITVAYRSPDYGYIYFNSVTDKNPFNENEKYLDAIILQSGYYSQSNVAWKMMHRILEQKYNEKYNMYLNHLGGDPIILSKISNDAQLDMQADGWHLIGISTADLDEVGLCYTIKKQHVDEVLDNDGNIITPLQLVDCLVSHTTGQDYIEEGEYILGQLSKKHPALKK